MGTHLVRTTNEDGVISFSGFKGGYEIVTDTGTAKIYLTDDDDIRVIPRVFSDSAGLRQ